MSSGPNQSGPQLVRLLRNLSATGDVLYLVAHPDDEENELVALLAYSYGVRIVCWSATRGAAGQNRVSPYKGEELGVYRTWETLAAREIDGGESLFGPFFDYGYSKHGAEAAEKWGETALVREIVRAIRIVQPQIVISRWRGDASDGHGHHAALGAAAKEAFGAAGDSGRFPELERVGLVPWQPRRLYQSMLGDWQPGEDVDWGVLRPDLESAGCLRVNTGRFNAPLGRTYQEQGALAAAEYLSQGSDRAPAPGDFYTYLRLALVAPGSTPPGAVDDLFDGLDPTLTGLADYPGEGVVELRRALEALQEPALAAAAALQLDAPWRIGPELLELVRRWRELESDLGHLGLDVPSQQALQQYARRKRADAETAAARCLGLRLDAFLDRAHLTPGESVRLSCRLWSYGPDTPTQIEFRPNVDLKGAEVRRVDDAGEGSAALFDVTVPSDAELSCPYWLRLARDAYHYVLPEVPYAAESLNPPLMTVTCSLRIGDHALELTRTALYFELFAGGYRELCPSILPPISAQPMTSLHVLRVRDVSQVLALNVGVLGHQTQSPIEGVLEVHVPGGWHVEPAQIGVKLQRPGDADSIPVRITVPPHAPGGDHEIRYGVRTFGRLYDVSTAAVMQTAPGLGGDPDEATCAREQFITRPSVVRVELIEMTVHEEHAYGYVTGAGDTVPSLLRGLGLSVHTLSDEELAHAPLDVYDTIVIGPNAYVVRDALRKAAKRLLEYVEAGGTLVVQYQGYPYETLGAAPFPFRYNQPHDRITLESSPVRVLEPGHYLFRFPNEITAADFSGWIRDRGMYFFGEWDEAYEPLLACADPGEDEKLGGLLVASFGKGTYAYCGYTMFRQLAGGVPGAFRLFANLLAIPEARIRRRMEHLRTVPLFATLDEPQLHRVGEIMTERWLSDGEYLFHEGEEGEELYLIATGALDVMKGDPEQLVGTSVPGVPIGELTALTGFRRAASLKARGKTHLFVISSDDFRELLHDHADIGERMVQLLARRLRDALTAAPVDGSPTVVVYE